ncbi:6375_t:CDS:1, partial [Gigaspora margarita]
DTSLQKDPVSSSVMSKAKSLNTIQENYYELSSNSANNNESNGNY